MLELNKDNFEKEVKQAETPVIVDFWASWCGPCMNLAPIFEEVSKDYEGKLKFAKVNVEENQELAGEFSVRGIPCLIVFNKGEEVDRIVGSLEKDALKEKIDEILGKI
ncbi:thioredoxin [Candidatus Woesearchaeota archaeon]|nr:thioredoxin [Candidatus Woesearchaeota archaeon]MBW2994495.1 thioredoxin [Candidatus Woesearchaeota archaeon]